MRTPSLHTENFNDSFYRVSSDQSAYIVSVSTESQSLQTGARGSGNPSGQEVAVASVGFLLLVSLWYFVRRDLQRRKADLSGVDTPQQGTSKAEKLSSHFPCTKCQYFKANMYLPCAVNPTVALKPEAINCRDFEARDGSEYTEATG